MTCLHMCVTGVGMWELGPVSPQEGVQSQYAPLVYPFLPVAMSGAAGGN